MQYLWLGLAPIGLIGGLSILSRAMTSGGRNEGSKLGGGLDGQNAGASDHHYFSGWSNGDGI